MTEASFRASALGIGAGVAALEGVAGAGVTGAGTGAGAAALAGSAALAGAAPAVGVVRPLVEISPLIFPNSPSLIPFTFMMSSGDLKGPLALLLPATWNLTAV